MRAGETQRRRRVPAHTKIGSLIAPLLDTATPIGVMDDDGRCSAWSTATSVAAARRGAGESDRAPIASGGAVRAHRARPRRGAWPRRRRPRRCSSRSRSPLPQRRPVPDDVPRQLEHRPRDPIDELHDWVLAQPFIAPAVHLVPRADPDAIDWMLDSVTDHFLALPW